MRIVVTGAAGFIGSHLVDALCAEGHDVAGIDVRPMRHSTMRRCSQSAGRVRRYEHHRVDLVDGDLATILGGADQVFHLAGTPGVRPSWGAGFEAYTRNNVTVTQRLLEACARASVGRYVYASSSSVYGDAAAFPTEETALPSPVSPYGVSKLAAEHLGHVYASNCGLSAAAVRLFTVYGPRQRSDMALHRLIVAALTGQPFRLLGSGRQRRDFTFVADAVSAIRTVAAAEQPSPAVFNVGGGNTASMLDVIELVREITGEELSVEVADVAAGDAVRTGADTQRLRNLGWIPQVDLAEGIELQARHLHRVVADNGGAR